MFVLAQEVIRKLFVTFNDDIVDIVKALALGEVITKIEKQNILNKNSNDIGYALGLWSALSNKSDSAFQGLIEALEPLQSKDSTKILEFLESAWKFCQAWKSLMEVTVLRDNSTLVEAVNFHQIADLLQRHHVNGFSFIKSGKPEESCRFQDFLLKLGKLVKLSPDTDPDSDHPHPVETAEIRRAVQIIHENMDDPNQKAFGDLLATTINADSTLAPDLTLLQNREVSDRMDEAPPVPDDEEPKDLSAVKKHSTN